MATKNARKIVRIYFGPDVLTKGTGGVLGAGFWDNEWKYSAANSAWRE